MLLSLVLLLLVAVANASNQCQKVETIDFSPTTGYCEQPIFFTFLPKTEEFQLLDNVCLTYFPLADDPNTFHLYVSRVYCDGSNDITSFIETSVYTGVNIKANPFLTVKDHVVGYAGCDTNIVYRCTLFGEHTKPYVFGASTICRPIGLSCLRKVEEIIRDHYLPDDEFYILPMKLPNRCVTQQVCTTPPNPFYNKLGQYPGRPGVALI